MYTIIFDPISDYALNYAYEHLHKVVKWDEFGKSDLEKAEAAIVRVHNMDKNMIEKMPNLKIIAKHGVGIDNIDKSYAKSKNIVVTNTPEANANSVAELIMGLTLGVLRKIVYSHEEVLKGVSLISPPELTGYELKNKKVGLIGLGSIGKIVANIFKNGFNCEVFVFDPFLDANTCKKLGITKISELNVILQESDIINISVPLNKQTENMISRKELQLMKKTSILINTSRGKIVNENDLYEALSNGEIYGAAMDAFENEPVSKDIKLLECNNFIASPHNGANTVDSLIRMGIGAIDEIIRLENSEENINVVN